MANDTPLLFAFERERLLRGSSRIAGVDEAGRGPLAGPVVAAAVVFPRGWIETGLPQALVGLTDSKRLSAGRRERFFEVITSLPEVERGIAIVEAEEIDRLNILRASHAAMVRALALLSPSPEHVLVDGLPVDVIREPQTAIVKGDSLSYSIAAASVLAKVTRDRLMVAHDERWPEYGFAVHKGYPTPQHQRALAAHGPCPIHRRSFAPVLAASAQRDLFGFPP
jgi:ribonuclease HII